MSRRFCELWTLERLRDERCVEEGECWLWAGGMSGPGKTTPNMHFRGRVVPAYSAAWLLKTGCEHVPKGMRLWRTCMDHRCIAPKHIKLGTHADMKADLAARGAYVCSPTRKAKITATSRRTRAKLKGGLDAAREIRASEKNDSELAAEHGMCRSRIKQIRDGKAWRETVLPGASIFSMGGA